MKLNYEVEWELDDDFIDDIVEQIKNTVKQYPDCNIEDCITEITEDNVNDLDESDHDNIELYIDKVIAEVKKRYLNRKQESKVFLATPAEELHSGQVQRIDDFGRICIPMNLRNLLKLESGDLFEIFFDTDHNLIIKKYHK